MFSQTRTKLSCTSSSTRAGGRPIRPRKPASGRCQVSTTAAKAARSPAASRASSSGVGKVSSGIVIVGSGVFYRAGATMSPHHAHPMRICPVVEADAVGKIMRERSSR